MENEYTTIAISEFKATCLKILKQVQRTGHQIVVTKRGEPVALISPPPSTAKTPSWLGSWPRERARREPGAERQRISGYFHALSAFLLAQGDVREIRLGLCGFAGWFRHPG